MKSKWTAHILNLIGAGMCFVLMNWLGIWQGFLVWTIALAIATTLWTMGGLLIKDLRGDRPSDRLT